MVPSARGSARASFTSRCCSRSGSPLKRGLVTATWKWSPPPVRSSTTSSVASGNAARSMVSNRAVDIATYGGTRALVRDDEARWAGGGAAEGGDGDPSCGRGGGDVGGDLVVGVDARSVGDAVELDGGDVGEAGAHDRHRRPGRAARWAEGADPRQHPEGGGALAGAGGGDDGELAGGGGGGDEHGDLGRGDGGGEGEDAVEEDAGRAAEGVAVDRHLRPDRGGGGGEGADAEEHEQGGCAGCGAAGSGDGDRPVARAGG